MIQFCSLVCSKKTAYPAREDRDLFLVSNPIFTDKKIDRAFGGELVPSIAVRSFPSSSPLSFVPHVEQGETDEPFEHAESAEKE